jgi:dual oxidase
MASETGCPIEMHKIPISKCDEMFDADCQGDKFMPFHRAHYDPQTGQSPNTPREQQNSMTSWIDASFVYSTKVNLRLGLKKKKRKGVFPNMN